MAKVTKEENRLRIEKAEWLLDMYKHIEKGGEIICNQTVSPYPYIPDEPHLDMTSETKVWIKKPLIETREISYPQAETKKPQLNTECFIPCVHEGVMFIKFIWDDVASDIRSLDRRLIHLNVEDAKEHTKALLGENIKEQNDHQRTKTRTR